MSWTKWLDRLVLYLPVVLMGLLAAASYWLVQKSPPSEAARPEKVLRVEPDYLMRAFSVRTFDWEGRPKTVVSGALARHFPLSDSFEIDEVFIRSIDARGRVTQAQANRALTNDDVSRVDLLGQARVVGLGATDRSSADEWRVSGEHLQVFLQERRLVSTKPVVAQRGADRFSADAARLDDNAQELVLQGRVRGQLMPPSKAISRNP